MKVNVEDLIAIHSFTDWVTEIHFFVTSGKCGSIRLVNEARKAAAADLRYEGYSAAEIKAIFRRVEKHFGLI